MIEIKHKYAKKVLFCSKTANTIKEALKEAIDQKIDLRNANLRDADLRNADLRNADLQDANLRDANLRDANLWNADLWNADLRNADLRNADLRNADLRDVDLLQIHASPYSIFCTGSDSVQIGCEIHPIDIWLSEYEEIGNKHGMSEEGIQRYRKYIEVCELWFRAKLEE